MLSPRRLSSRSTNRSLRNYAIALALILFGCGGSGNAAGASGSGPGGAGNGGGSGGTTSAGGVGGTTSAGGAGGTTNTGGAGGTTNTGGAGGSAGGTGGSGGASTAGGGQLCPDLGWCILPNTKLRSVCPNDPAVQAQLGCFAVVNNWSGGAADQVNNRLLIWGGGHHGYYGNEVYALDLSDLTMKRLNDPSDPSNVATCPEAYPDGTPSSRHTYDGLAYIPDTNQLFAYGGSRADCGGMSDRTWRLDLSKMSWTLEQPTVNNPAGCSPFLNTPGAMADYDAKTHAVYLSDLRCFWRFDPTTATYTSLYRPPRADYHLSATIDTTHRLFVMIGGGEAHAAELDTASHTISDWTLTGCDGLVNAASPGLAYDPVQDRVVGWAGGSTIYLLDTTTRQCTTVNYSGGPAQQAKNGTFGRFRYFPKLGVFALVNDVDTNAYTLRLTK